MIDYSSAEVFFGSCKTLVPFKSPSDAAIARLSAECGFTINAIQAVLDHIVFNPLFQARDVSFQSAACLYDNVAEHRRKQAYHRARIGQEGQDVGGPPPLVVSIVVDWIGQDMAPFRQELDDLWVSRECCSNLRKLSLVHRSWTDIADRKSVV